MPKGGLQEVIDGIEIYPVDDPAFHGPTSCHATGRDANYCDQQLRGVFDFDPESEIYSRNGVPVTCGAIVDGIKWRYGREQISLDPTFVRIVAGRVEERIKSLL